MIVTLPASGAGGVGLTSSAYTLDRAQKPISIWTPSWGTAAFLTVQFGTGSGTGFTTYNRQDGSSAQWVVFSGTAGGGVAVLEFPPSPWFRLAVSSAQSAVMSCTVEAVLAR